MDNSINFRRAGILLAYPMAYAYVRIMLYGWHTEWMATAAYTSFALIFIIVSEIVRMGRRPFDRKMKGETVFWYVMMLMSAFTAPFGPSTVLSCFALHLCAVYSVLVSNDVLLGEKTCGLIPADLIHGFYVKSFAGFPNFVTDWTAFKREGDRKARNAAIGLLVFGFVFVMLIFFGIALNLLSKIDKDIADFLNTYLCGILEYFRKIEFEEILFRVIFAIPVCFYLYGLISRSAKSDGVREKRFGINLVSFFARGRKVPCVITSISAGFFVLMYILFFAKRTAYFMGGFTGEVPDGQLVAYFARNGFFELVGIMAVNMCVYLTIYLFEKRNNNGRVSLPGRILVTLLMAESIIFAAIAMSKLWLYFSIYGYTPKRMLAMWGTLALGFSALMSILTVNRGKSHFRPGVFFTAVSYIAVCILSWVLASA